MAYSEKHRESARHAQLVDDVWEALKREEGMTDEMEEVVNKAIRFYGANITKLPECNPAVFKLAEIFLKTSDEKQIAWTFRDANALLLLMVTMLLKRKDEATVRAAAIIVRKLISRQSDAELARSAEIHQKPTQLVFHKMSKVATYYTQFKLLEVLHVFLQGQDEFIAGVFKKEKLVVESGSIQDATHFFESLDSENFVMTAREFLDTYNQTMCNPSFIHSHRGYIVALDEKKKIPTTAVFFDFCLRNLSISFFVKATVVTGDQQLDEENYFIEFEDCEVTVDTKRFVNPNHVQLIVKSSRHQVLDESDGVVNLQLSGFVKMIISKDDELILDQIVPRFQSRSPMLYDNNTDLESMASFRTINTVIANERPVPPPTQAVPMVVDLNTSADTTTQVPQKTVAVKSKNSPELKLPPQQSVEEIFKVRTSEDPKVVEKVKRQQTQVAKVGPLTAKQARGEIFDIIQEESDDLPPFRRFMSQAREQRGQGSQPQEASQMPETPEEQVPPKNRRTQKSPAKKRARAPVRKPAAKKAAPKPKKKTGYSSEEVEDEVLEQFKDALNPSEPLAPVEMKPKRQTKSRARSSTVLNSSAEDREIIKSLPSARQQKKQSYFTAKTKPPAATKAPQAAAAKKTQKVETSITQKPRRAIEYLTDTDLDLELIRKDRKVDPPCKIIRTTRQQEPAEKIAPVYMVAPKQLKEPKRVVQKQEPPAIKEQTPKLFIPLRKQTNDLRPAAPAPPPVDTSFDQRPLQTSELRCPFREIPHVEDLKTPRNNRSRPDGEENHPRALEPREDFDKLMSESRKEEQLPKKTETPSSRRKKRVSFNEDISVIPEECSPPKRAKTAAAPVEKKAPIPLEVGPETISQEIQYNTAMLGENPLLNDFINGSQQHSSFEDNFDEVIMTTQTIQKKKLSPTIVRTVQYRQINENRAEELITSPRTGSVGQASAMFLQKARAEVENTMKELQKLQDPVNKSLKSTTKASIINASGVVRSTHARLKNHVAEHVKLLKRVQHSKRAMTQLFEENSENIRAWRETVKQGLVEKQQLIEERVHQVDTIHQNMVAKQETLKKEVWREYLADISSKFQEVLQRHQDF